ncbi:kelch-like protein 33 [Danio rerio]|uniref:Kelch-like protein 33 n=1 Tax=Danio rerio TaxID=7955 RepID=A0AB32TX65_DANRE
MAINQQCLQSEWRSSWRSAREDESVNGENEWIDQEKQEEEYEQEIDTEMQVEWERKKAEDGEGCSIAFSANSNHVDVMCANDNSNNVDVCRDPLPVANSDAFARYGSGKVDESQDDEEEESTLSFHDTSGKSEGLMSACKINGKAYDVDEELSVRFPATSADGLKAAIKNDDGDEILPATSATSDDLVCKYVDINSNEEHTRSVPTTSGSGDHLLAVCSHKSKGPVKEFDKFENDEDDRFASASTSTCETGRSEKNVTSQDEEQQTKQNQASDDNEYGGLYSFEDFDDEDVDVYPKKLYSDPAFASVVFQTLENMMLNLVLTDLTLCTENGHQFQVHSIVLSAVSLYVQAKLRLKPRQERNTVLCLGPEVQSSGLAAVVEFAYTGKISNLNKDNFESVYSAAISLEALDVLELCREEKRIEDDKTGGKNEERKRFSAEEHLNVCLGHIGQLWAQRLGCDVELEAEGRVFHAHRVILAASSDYFRGMFTSGMKESRQELVSLLLIRACKFEVLLHYCYSGALALGWGCVFDLACTSLQLQFQTAFSLCTKFLHQETDAHNCLDVVSFAEAYGMPELHAFANDFVLRHFQDVSITPKFQDLPVEKLKKYLQSDSLCVPSELSVFKAVLAWIEAFPRQRVKLAKELMGTIQFHLMTYKEFKEVKYITSWPRIGAKHLYNSLLEEFCFGSPAAQSNFRAYMPKHSLVLVGGERITDNLDKRLPCREMWFSNSLQNHVGLVKKVEWRTLGTLPDKPRFNHGVCAVMGKLYIVGGRYYYGKDDTMKCTYRYDPMQNTWQRLADMNEKRGNFALVVLNDQIYAIGGERDSEVNMESVEVYCPNKNSWRFVHPLEQTLCCHASTVWNGKIFISGGLDSQYHCLSSMILYSPESRSSYLAEMSKDRALHCMETLGDRLYVAGGVSSNAQGSLEDQLACEVYDPVANSWSAIMSFSVPHVGSASAVLEGKIYVIGGYSHKDYSDTRSVHRYDPTTECWENLSQTPGPNTCVAACVLPIPAHLRK